MGCYAQAGGEEPAVGGAQQVGVGERGAEHREDGAPRGRSTEKAVGGEAHKAGAPWAGCSESHCGVAGA